MISRRSSRPQLLIALFFVINLISAITWPWDDDDSSSSSSSSASATSTEQSGSTESSDSLLSSIASFISGDDEEVHNSYAPVNVTCPSHKLVREADGISTNESAYLEQRHVLTNKNLINFLEKVANLTDFDAEKFINDNTATHNISIGLAFSGGGYRAMLNAAGQILALDDRYDESNSDGLGGLLQSSTYLTGLSGGNWMVGTLVLNNWLSVGDIVNHEKDIWDLEESIFNPNGINLYSTAKYYLSIGNALGAKRDAGFDTSITDIWGRALSFQFFDNANGGQDLTWSSIRNLSEFKDHNMPFPIVVANGRTPGTYIMNENSTVFEISPYELGSWDPSLRSFVDVKYIGSSLDNGEPTDNTCVNGFDNGGFVMGTSSSLFNQIIISLNSMDINKLLKSLLLTILSRLSYSQDDIAAYKPNPFYGTNYGDYGSISSNDTLFLVDGGEDNQNVPLYPLIQNSRDVDVIFAYDNSADTLQNWPNGSSLVFTYQRQFADQGHGTPFPYVPNVATFLEEELNTRPVFFGCDAANLSSLIEYHGNKDINETDIPLVIYMPNSEVSYATNFSTYKLSYEDDEKWGLIRNGFEVSSRKNFTDDQNWAKCVGCAIIRRQQERFGFEQSDECKQCFLDYCWEGGAKSAAAQSFGSHGSATSTKGIGGSSTSSQSRTTQSTSRTSSGSSSRSLSSSHSTSSSSKQSEANSVVQLLNVAYLVPVAALFVGLLCLS